MPSGFLKIVPGQESKRSMLVKDFGGKTPFPVGFAFLNQFVIGEIAAIIDSVIVEPGPYVTPIFQKQEEAADTLRSADYGPATEIPQNLRKQLVSSPLNPQEVADCVIDLIELPAGNRPFRFTAGLPVSYGGLNYYSAQLQNDLLNWAGNASLATFRTRV